MILNLLYTLARFVLDPLESLGDAGGPVPGPGFQVFGARLPGSKGSRKRRKKPVSGCMEALGSAVWSGYQHGAFERADYQLGFLSCRTLVVQDAFG